MKSPYPTYKPTLLPWLPKVPEHWDLSKISHAFAERRETVSDKDFEPLSVTKNGILPQLETAAKTDNGDNRKKVVKGDFVINSRSDRKGSAGVSPLDGSVSVISTVLKPLTDKTDTSFTGYLLTCYYFQEEFYRHGKGIVADLWSTKFSEMKGMEIPLPPLPEQRQIATFLDHKCGLIDTCIQKKTRLIELLKEQKQAIINKAVTRGLDDRVHLKPSGIEWLGEVPEHWEVKKLKHVARMQNGLALNEKNVPANSVSVPYLRVANVQDGYIDLTEVKEVRISPEQIERYSLEKGDLLMNEGGDFDKLGRGVVWEGQISPCIHQNHVYALKVKKDRDPYWINLLSLTFYGKCYFISKSKKTTNLASISSKNIMEFPVLMPPENEINEIKKFVEEEEMRVGAIITRIEREIELMQEYKTTLIAEAVTGRIDVREWQTRSKHPTQTAHATH